MTDNPIFLIIETATEVCSVALSRGTEILSVIEATQNNSHAKNLLPYIDDVLSSNNMTTNDLNAIVVSSGPGSYTGLRIGVSTAKGIAYTAGIPLIAVDTLTGIASGCLDNFDNNGEFVVVPMIDARRMEVYTAIFDTNLSKLDDISAKIINENSFSDLLSKCKVVFCGNGMPKCKELLSKNDNSCFFEESISAKNLLKPALIKWKSAEFEDIAYFEPFYLKEYVAGKPVVKGLK